MSTTKERAERWQRRVYPAFVSATYQPTRVKYYELPPRMTFFEMLYLHPRAIEISVRFAPTWCQRCRRDRALWKVREAASRE